MQKELFHGRITFDKNSFDDVDHLSNVSYWWVTWSCWRRWSGTEQQEGKGRCPSSWRTWPAVHRKSFCQIKILKITKLVVSSSSWDGKTWWHGKFVCLANNGESNRGPVLIYKLEPLKDQFFGIEILTKNVNSLYKFVLSKFTKALKI